MLTIKVPGNAQKTSLHHQAGLS